MLTSHLRRTIATSFRRPFIYSHSQTVNFNSSPANSPAVKHDADDETSSKPLSTAENSDGDEKLKRKLQTATARFIPSSAINDALKATAADNGGDEKLTAKVNLFTAAANKNEIESAINDGDDKVTAVAEVAAGEKERVSIEEVKKLMRLVNVDELKTKLGEEGKEIISYGELLTACQGFGVAESVEEAVEFAKVLDESGVVILFRDKVYLHPHKVVELVSNSVPLALTPEDDPRREELKRLQERKEEIDRQAHTQVRVILWSGLGIAIMQVGLFFRLTFWEFSWDVMEPIAFFTTATGLLIGYGYFMMTSRDPTYQDLMKRLFMSRQRKLFKKYHFDISRFKELSDKCKCPLDKHHPGDN